MKPVYLNKIILILFLLIQHICFSQFPTTIEFSGSTPSGWTSSSNASGNNFNLTYGPGASNGVYCGSGTNKYGASIAADVTNDDMIISSGYTLTAGYSYSISLQSKNTSTLRIYAASTATFANLIAGTQLLNETSPPTTCGTSSTTTSFVPSSTGTYYFGFRVNGNSGRASINTIVITETAPVTITWDGSSSTTWSTAANWDLNRAPNSSDIIVIPSGLSNYPATITAGSYNNLSSIINNLIVNKLM